MNELRVCIVCPYASRGEAQREETAIAPETRNDRRACAPGIPLEADDMEAE